MPYLKFRSTLTKIIIDLFGKPVCLELRSESFALFHLPICVCSGPAASNLACDRNYGFGRTAILQPSDII
jgi:hypothetical protein